jgi:hypothetical protein
VASDTVTSTYKPKKIKIELFLKSFIKRREFSFVNIKERMQHYKMLIFLCVLESGWDDDFF